MTTSEELLRLVDRLDDLVHKAPAVPLTDQVRVDREDVYEILDEMRARLRVGVPQDGTPAPPSSGETLVVLDRLDDLVGNAKSTMFGHGINLERGEVRWLADELRERSGSSAEWAEFRFGLDRLDGYLRDAEKLDREALYVLLADLRAAHPPLASAPETGADDHRR